MKTSLVSLTRPVSTTNISSKNRNISFRGGPNSDSFEHNQADLIAAKEQVYKIKSQLETEFSERIDMRQKGDKVKIPIPNAIMLVDEQDQASKYFVDWVGETVSKKTGTKFVKIAGDSNGSVQKGLGQTLKKAREEFVNTGKRTLIYVEDFDKLITEGQNTPSNIASLKDIMCRTATDFGSTIIFRTKDATKLVDEAIQPHRVTTKIMIPINGKAISLNNEYWQILGKPEHILPNEGQTPFTVFNTEKINIKPEIIQNEPDAIQKVPVDANVTPIEPPKVEANKPPNVDIPPESKIHPPKTEAINENIETTVKSSGKFKIIAILSTVGAAIAGVIYFMRNEKKQQGVKESANPPNISVGK